MVRQNADFDAGEDAVQEALLAAALHWPRDGVPDRPLGWLVRTATHRLVDQRRSSTARRRREERVVLDPALGEVPDRDDTLDLLLLCCHPSLTSASAIALTLRAVGGLSTAEIAAAFLVPEATMAQRISRAKRQVRAAGATFARPPAEQLPARVALVLHVLYLVFNEGYTASGGAELHRGELSREALRLTRAVREARPDDAEVAGLLALMLLLEARRQARVSAAGDLVPLPDQDRSRWDGHLVAEGLALLAATPEARAGGDYQLQARIAAVHDRASRADDTDWTAILSLYERLDDLTANPVVTLNRAVAVAMVHGPSAGLELLDAAATRLPALHRLDAVRAHLLEQAGQPDAAAAAFAAAADATTNLAEQRYLAAQAARLRAESVSCPCR